MFSMLPTPAHTYNQSHHYTPVVSSPLSSSPLRSSPLSSRDNNVPARAEHHDPMMSPTPSKPTRPSPNTSSGSSRETAYSKRPTKVNPLIHGRSSSTESDGRETRRKLFLKRVREDQDDKRWKARGGDDEMMRSIWIAEQRRRDERQRREAVGLDDLPVEEVEYLSLDEVMADKVALEEEAELEALFGSMPEAWTRQTLQTEHYDNVPAEAETGSLLWSMDGQVPTTSAPQDQPPSETPYGSDDDEYDHIFMDVIEEENRIASQSVHPADTDQNMMDLDLDMDMS